jgi:hypothetical protein
MLNRRRGEKQLDAVCHNYEAHEHTAPHRDGESHPANFSMRINVTA